MQLSQLEFVQITPVQAFVDLTCLCLSLSIVWRDRDVAFDDGAMFEAEESARLDNTLMSLTVVIVKGEEGIV